MSNIPTDPKIIERIRKMLALANDAAATEGERDNATRFAHKLLTQHNLSMSCLDGPSEERKKQSVLGYGRPWAMSLAQATGKLFFCDYFYVRVRTVRNQVLHYFVGLESNVTTSTEMTTFLVTSIRKEAGKLARAGGHNATWRRSFCVGAMVNLRNRMYELRETSKKEPGTGLMVVSLYDQEKAANEAFLKISEPGLVLKSDRSSSKIHSDAYNSGKAYASKLSLNRQVKGTSNETLRLK